MNGPICTSRLGVADANRPAATGIHQSYRAAFLGAVAGAMSKQRPIRSAGVPLLHGVDSQDNTSACAGSALFSADVVGRLMPLLEAAPDVRICPIG